MPGWLNAVIGAAEIGAGIAGEIAGAALIGTGVGAPLGVLIMAAPALLGMGIGTEINAIGTMLSKGPLAGGSTSERNPIAARECVYGRVAVGGTMIYCSQFGNNNKYVDMVFDLADFNPSLYVTALMVDRQVVQIDTTAVPAGVPGSTHPQINGGMSFTPVQQNSAIGGGGNPSPRISSINRVGDVVTVVTMDNGTSGGDIPLLIPGSYVIISGVPIDSNPAHDIFQTLNGRYQVTSVSAHTGSSVTFTYTCGGPAASVTSAGYVSTQWPQYGSRIYMEVLTGTQTLGQTFVGMTVGTPDPANPHGGAAITYANQGYGGGIGGPWTANCSGVGCTLVMIRLNYDSKEMPYIPQISFLLSGKATIFNPDPAASHGGLAPLATGYTENWALCVADFLCDPIAGDGMTIGVDVSLADLITAAVISDQAVSLAAGGTEPRYACNGKFSLAMSRGEILKNLLTAGAGRIRESANGWVIQAGAWPGSPAAAPGMAHLMPYEWSPTVTMTELYNGVKGTYIWPGNNWQSSDFPPYAQDSTHDPSHILGYGTGGSGYSDSNVIADGGQRRWLDIQLPFTISPSAAQRIAKIELLRRRQFGTGVLRYDLFAYQFTSLDIITETIPYLGSDWTAKTLEVSKFRFTPSPTGFITELQVQEADSSVYDWSTIEELTPAGFTQPVIPSTQNPSVPTGLTLESDVTTEFVETSGKTHSRILVSWTPPTDGYVLSGGHIEEQFQLVGALIWTSLPSVDPNSTFTYVSDVVDGDQYNVQIRSVNAAGTPSAWIFAGPVTVGSSFGAGVSVFGPNGGISFPPYGDPLYPQAVSNLSVGGQVQSDGSVLVSVKVSPVVPASVLSTLTAAPIIDGTFTVSSTGGTIPGPQSVFVSLVAVDSAGSFTALSNQITCVIPSGTTGSIALTIDNYTSAMVNFLVYVGLNQEILYYRYTVTAAGTLTLTSIATVTGNSYGMPDTNFDHFVIATTKIALAAVPLPATPINVAAVMVVTAYTFLGGPLEKVTIAGAAFTPSALIGRTLSFVQLVSGTTFPIDFLITANDATSITVDIPSPPVGWMGTPATLTVGDLVCVRMQPTMSGGGTIVTDSLLTALTLNQFAGFVLRVLFADGSNESSFIVSNTTSGSFTVQADNPFVGSNPVWFWIEAGSFSASVPCTPAQDSAYSSAGVPLSIAIDNLPGFVGVQLFAANSSNELSEAGFSPIRDILFLGQTGTVGANPGYFTVPFVSGQFVIDIANGFTQRMLLTTATATGTFPNVLTIATIPAPIYTGGTIAAGMPKLTLYVDQDATGTWPIPLFNTRLTMVNPGFESAISSGWSLSPGPATVSTAQSRNVLGIQCASDITANDIIYQDVPGLTLGAVYVIEAWLYTDGATSGFLTLNDSTGANIVTGSAKNPGPLWTRVSLLYTANATGKVRIQLTHDATAGQIYWDDVSVYAFAGAYASGVGLQGISGVATLGNVWVLNFRGGVWAIDSFTPGVSLS